MTIWNDLLGAEVKFYQGSKYRTRCIEAGKGQALVLLHGSGGHAEAFARNVLVLGQDFHVFAIDMLGHGFTDKPEGSYEATDYIGQVIDFMDAAGIDRAHLAGESLGGWVACNVALLAPERVRKIISITGAGLHGQMDEESRAYYEQGSTALKRANEQFVANPTKENLRHRLNWLFHDPADVTDELLETRWAIYHMPGAQAALARTGGSVQNPKYALTVERLRELKAPLLFLWTEFNPSMPAPVARRTHEQVPGSKYVELKECAHWPQWEEPEAFNAAVRDFLLENEQAR